jgi:O-methyltransferase involved in polyketide biosynthesis
MPIENVSDTARWVAMYRALESDRPDAHFHDPYARLLAGERGDFFFLVIGLRSCRTIYGTRTIQISLCRAMNFIFMDAKLSTDDESLPPFA